MLNQLVVAKGQIDFGAVEANDDLVANLYNRNAGLAGFLY